MAARDRTLYSLSFRPTPSKHLLLRLKRRSMLPRQSIKPASPPPAASSAPQVSRQEKQSGSCLISRIPRGGLQGLWWRGDGSTVDAVVKANKCGPARVTTINDCFAAWRNARRGRVSERRIPAVNSRLNLPEWHSPDIWSSPEELVKESTRYPRENSHSTIPATFRRTVRVGALRRVQ